VIYSQAGSEKIIKSPYLVDLAGREEIDPQSGLRLFFYAKLWASDICIWKKDTSSPAASLCTIPNICGTVVQLEVTGWLLCDILGSFGQVLGMGF
jgi:hypothetical protein